VDRAAGRAGGHAITPQDGGSDYHPATHSLEDSMNIPEAPTRWNDNPKFDWKAEWALFRCRGIEDNRWQQRFSEWWIHVTTLAAMNKGLLSSSTTSYPVPWQDARANILFSHLGILDTKYGFLLTFNSLLFLVPGTSAAIVTEVLKEQWGILPHSAVLALYSLSALFLLLWFSTTWFSLNGLRDIIWGDLGFGGRPLRTILQHETIAVTSKPLATLMARASALEAAEEDYARDLIIAVAKRSNIYRVTIRFVKVNLGITALFALLCFGLIVTFHK
jgi:hypothetical protein